MVKITI